MDFGKFEGERKEWYENGQLKCHESYKDGKAERDLKEWYKNGQLERHGSYKDGKYEGERKEWYENGQLRYQWFFKDGKHEGERKEWTETGQLVIHEFYKDGKRVTTNSKFFRGWYRLQTLWREYKERKRIWFWHRKMAYLVAIRVFKLEVTNGLVGEIANAV